MSAAAHTPGPWIIFHADEDGPNDILPAGRLGHIALSIDRIEDARLIAAAPEMLTALKGLLHSIDHPADTDSAVALERELRRIDDARAAIAKAEGRS